MTGYARAMNKSSTRRILVEITAVNNRFLKLQSKVPDHLQALRLKLEEAVRKHVVRGSLILTIQHESYGTHAGLTINKALARRCVREMKMLCRELGLGMPEDVSFLTTLPGLISTEESLPAISREDTRLLLETLDKALVKLVADRRREGRALVQDLKRRQKQIVKETRAIKKNASSLVEVFSKRLLDRMNDMLRAIGFQAEPAAILHEVAAYSERVDITEELTRLDSHLNHFGDILASGGECGKKIEFLLQEIHREINTLGSKAGNTVISPHVVSIKGELEKIREQVQNIE